MKVNAINYIFLSIVMLFCLVTTGCNNEKENNSQHEQTETVQNENGAVTAISISEQGGVDGIVIDWKVYQEDNKYILSYFDHNAQYDDNGANGDTAKPEIFEINEQEYSDIMSLDYVKYISEYDASDWEGVADAISFRSVITYANGVEESTQANMTYATRKLRELLGKFES